MTVETMPQGQASSYREIYRGISFEISRLLDYYCLKLLLSAANNLNQKFPQLRLFDQHGLEARISEYKTAEEDNCCADALEGCFKYLLGVNNKKTN